MALERGKRGRAWLNVTKNPINGIDRKSPSIWKKVFDTFRASTTRNIVDKQYKARGLQETKQKM